MVRLLHPLPAELPGELRVEGEPFHYLARVLRLAVGDALEVFDGEGRACPAQVARVGEGLVVLRLGEARQLDPAPPLFVLQGLPKGDKLEWVLQKGTELGAAAFYPVRTQRSVVKLEGRRAEERRARWQKIAGEAARQCGRAEAPRVHPVQSLPDAVRSLPPTTRLLILDEEEHATRLAEAVRALPPSSPLAFLVGPEGGLAREEVALLVSGGAVPVSLGRRVLRTETVALAVLAILQHLRGELG